MSRSVSIGGLALGLTVAAGCNPNTPQHTSEWYFQHPEAAKERLAVCDAQSLKDRDADCVNAQNGTLEYMAHGHSSMGNPYK